MPTPVSLRLAPLAALAPLTLACASTPLASGSSSTPDLRDGGAAESSAAGDHVALADLARIRQLGSIDVAADGSKVVYTVRSVFGDVTDRSDDVGYRTHLWYVDVESGELARPLTSGERGGSSPAISPDGSTLAFVRAGGDDREGGGRGQVWLLSLTGPGEARQLTELEHGASSPRWFPDGGSLLVTSALPESELEGEPPFDWERAGRTFGDVEDEAEDADEAEEEGDETAASAPDADLESLRRFLADDSGDGAPDVKFELDFQGEQGLAGEPRYAHLHRVDAATGEATELAAGWRGYGGARISPDGTRIAFASMPPVTDHPDRVQRASLWIMDVAEGEPRLLVDDEGWSFNSPRWSTDGASLYFTASDRSQPTYAQTELAKVPAAGGTWTRLLPDHDRHVQNLHVVPSADGNAANEWVVFRSPTEGNVATFGLSADAGQVQTLEPGGAVLSFEATPEVQAYVLSTVENPGEVWITGPDGPRQVSAHHTEWLAATETVDVAWRWTEAPDGTRVQYWVMPPVGAKPGERYPTVLSLHGGPMVMWGPGSISMWHEWQWLCANGYGVVYPNQRGSNGYGFEFQRANHRNWGHGPASDALAAMDAAAAEYDWIDTDQLFVTGGSYAGYLTAWIVGQDDRFKAAVAQRGVYDLVTFFGEGNAWRLVPYCFGGYPWEPEVRDVLERESPFTYVDQITTPLLVMHASQDLRTGVSQSEMLYRALKVLERPVEYVRYPDAGHDLSRTGDPHQRMDRLGRILEFFERYRTAPQ